jgi:hypothetical protein
MFNLITLKKVIKTIRGNETSHNLEEDDKVVCIHQDNVYNVLKPESELERID